MRSKVHLMIETGEHWTEDAIGRTIAMAGDKHFHDYIESVDVIAPEVPEHGVSGYAVLEVPSDRVDGMTTEIEWYIDAALSEWVDASPDEALCSVYEETPCDHEDVRTINASDMGTVDRCEDCGKYL